MAVIVIVASIVAPKMSRFFQGRTLDNEARRFITLTRYAQNRAVSEGIPMLVWMDEKNRRYGAEAQPGYLEKDDKAVEYDLATDLEIEVGSPISSYIDPTRQQATPQLPANLRYIRIGTDGYISDQSPQMILIRRDENDVLAIGPSRNWQSYEISTNKFLALR